MARRRPRGALVAGAAVVGVALVLLLVPGGNASFGPRVGLAPPRADLPVAPSSVQARVVQAQACARVLPSRPGGFAPVSRPVPGAIPVTGFGPATALCGTDPGRSGLYYTALVWTVTVPPARIAAYERLLVAKGYTRQSRDSLYARANTSVVYTVPYGYSDTSLTSCADCLLRTVELQRVDGGGVELRWV